MRLGATFKIAVRALRRNLLRTVLTMLGIVIGVGAVIAMVSIGNGAKAQVESQIASLGQNVILIFSGSTSRGGMNTGWGSAGTLSVDDAEALRREIPTVLNVSAEVRTYSQVAAGSQNWLTQVLGESADYLEIRQWPLKSGAMFSEADVRAAAKIAIIGTTTAQQLFGDNDPVGQIVRIKNSPFIIAGLLAPKGLSIMGSDQDDVLIVPYTSAMKRLTGNTSLRSIAVQASSPATLMETQQQITELFRQRHRIMPGRDDDFTVRTQQEIAEAATATSKIMTVLLGAIASVSLLVGGIGIMNIMLVSVTERTREIGLRMAIGAKPRSIMLQFLVEALVLSLAGGMIGVAVGVGAATWLAGKFKWPMQIQIDVITISVIFSALVGIVFGIYPARKASQLDPIDALRYE